jgi:Flp pilus assembly protein TadG
MSTSDVALSIVTRTVAGVRFCRRGAAATELALILPLLTTMILAVFEYGAVIYSYSAMQFGANRVARTVAVNRMSNAQAQTEVRNYLPGWVRNDVSVAVTQTAPGDPETNLVQVQLAVAAAQATPMALLTRAVPWQLTANVAMKQELPYVD